MDLDLAKITESMEKNKAMLEKQAENDDDEVADRKSDKLTK